MHLMFTKVKVMKFRLLELPSRSLKTERIIFTTLSVFILLSLFLRASRGPDEDEGMKENYYLSQETEQTFYSMLLCKRCKLSSY